jgi:hypothetical protein
MGKVVALDVSCQAVVAGQLRALSSIPPGLHDADAAALELAAPENGKLRVDSPIACRNIESLFPRQRGQITYHKYNDRNQPRASATRTVAASATPQLLQALPPAGSLTIYNHHCLQYFLGRRKCKHPHLNPRRCRRRIISEPFHALQEPLDPKVAARLFLSPQAIRNYQARHQAQRSLVTTIHT